MPDEISKWSHDATAGKVLSFFDSEGVANALEMNSFTIEEEVSTLVQHMRDPDAKIALRAHNQLRRVLNEVAKASGLMATQELTSDKEGNQSVKITRNTKLLSSLKETSSRSKVEGKPDYAASYLPPTDPGRKTSLPSNESNGSDGSGEIRGTDPVRLSDEGHRQDSGES